MPRLTPIHWKVLECIFQNDGFVFHKQEGSHRSYFKKEIHSPVVIPTYKDVYLDIIKSNMRTAGMSRDQYFQYLEECRKRA